MYPRQTDFFLNQYEDAVKRPLGYLLIDLKTATQDNCRLRTNILPSEEFSQVEIQENIPQELLKYLKQQNLSTVPLLPAMQQLKSSMDSVLSRTDLGEDEKAKQYFQLQNRYLTFKKKMNANTPHPDAIRSEEINSDVPESTSIQASSTATAFSTPLNLFNVTSNLTQAAILQKPKTVSATPLNPTILTPPPTVETPSQAPKRKRRRIYFVNYLDDDANYRKQRKQTRRYRYRAEPYKYSKDKDDDWFLLL